MHSPKFNDKIKALSLSVNASNLTQSWKKKVRIDLRRQIIPDPIEHLDFHINHGPICASIANEIRAGSYVPSHVTRITSEKANGLCRQIVLPDPRDALVLQVLADSLWIELKKAAPSKKSFYAPKDHTFNKGKKGLEDEYGPIAQWIKFQEEILGFSNRYKYIVVTDIANYYDWIRYTGLRSVISDLVYAKEVVLDILLYVLKAMIWRPDYMPNDDLGLPQCDFDAPRLLAHTFLFEIDGLLENYPGIEFARYMDDIDIGVNTIAEAKRVVRDLDLTLQSRHIRLNSGKTKILSSSDARRHFCVRENAVLDKVEARLEALAKNGALTSKKANLLKWLSVRWWKGNVFAQGNGSKILKRLINYSRVYGVSLDERLFRNFFIASPSLRETLLRYVAKSCDPVVYIRIIDDILASKQVIDHVTILRISSSLVTARYTRRIPRSLLQDLLGRFDKTCPFQLFSMMLLISRFRSYRELRKLIDSSEYIWRTEPIIVRCVAGLICYFRGHRDFGPVSSRLRIVGGSSSKGVLDFFDDIIWGSGFSKVINFLKAPNPSYINGITHSKFGMLYGYLSNLSYTKNQKVALVSKHPLLYGDVYYGTLLRSKLRSIPP